MLCDRSLVFIIVFFGFTFWFGSPALTEEVLLVPENSKGTVSNEFWVLRFQEERIFVESYEQGSGSLQELISRYVFHSEPEARLFFEGRTKNGVVPRSLAHVQTEVPGQFLWTATETWSWDWELRYLSWIDSIKDRDFLADRGIATDCADALISFRWIFARIYGLPMAQRLAVTGVVFSHESMQVEWMSLPTAQNWFDDLRFLAALNYLLDNTYTETLQRDTYPIAVSPEAVLPGGIFLHMGATSNHARLIKDFYRQGVMTWNSTTPRSSRSLFEEPLYVSDEDLIGPKKGGFRRFLWPTQKLAIASGPAEWILISEQQMPYFSEEQYAPEFVINAGSADGAWKMRLLPGYIPNPSMVLDDLTNKITADVEARKNIVKEGYQTCFPNLCPVGSPLFEVHSTPNRDRRIFNKVQAVLKLLAQNSSQQFLQDAWEFSIKRTRFRIDGIKNKVSLKEIVEAFVAGTISADPNASLAQRWGQAELNSEPLR